MKNKRAKQPKYFITPMGGGRYHATWKEGKFLYEMVFTDKEEVETIRKVKNPYKHNVFPYFYIPFESPKPIIRERKS